MEFQGDELDNKAIKNKKNSVIYYNQSDWAKFFKTLFIQNFKSNL